MAENGNTQVKYLEKDSKVLAIPSLWDRTLPHYFSHSWGLPLILLPTVQIRGCFRTDKSVNYPTENGVWLVK